MRTAPPRRLCPASSRDGPCSGAVGFLTRALLIVAVAGTPAHADELTLSVQRLAFVAADKALQAGAAFSFTALSDYPLYPYLLFRDLRQRLEKQPAAEVRAFLRTHADTPLAGRLRGAWLRQLAKAQRWDEFLRDYRPDGSVELRCWQRRALLHTGQPQRALENIAQIWMQGVSLPNACDPLFELWRQQGGFTVERVWRRFGLALDKDQRGLAVYLKELLPASQRPIAERWLRVDANPRLILAPDGLDPRDARAAAIVLHGLRRWSRQDSVAAAAALDVVKQRYSLPPPALAEMQRQLALFVASRGHPSALARLNALPDTVVDAQVREWRVRIHLTEPDWRGVLTWLDGLRPEESAQPLWLYWRARALEVGGQADESRVIYGRLASQRDYHGFLAADRIGAPYQWVDAPLVFSTTELDALEQSPAVQRARELFLLGRFREAGVEWQRAIAAHTPQELQKAAKLAQRWGWHHQAIMTLARTNHRDDLALRFPLPYRAQIAAAAQDAGLDPAWIYAILRQESLFRTDARSSAGALGLMQIMPATAARIAQERGASAPGDDDLLQAETSIRFGTVYLRRVLDRLRNHPALATAAYNAGPGAVARWLPVHAPIEADRWVETIPYAETRHYVKRVMEYAIIYGKRLNAEPPRLRTYMSAIAPPS